MAFSNSTGAYTPASGATTAAPGQTIASLTWNNIFTDLSTALTQLGEGTFAPPSTSLTCANGANSNLTLPATARFYVTGPTGAFTITGFAGGTDGRRIYLYNPTTFTMTLVNKATSTAANQINTLTGSNIVLNGSSYATLSYDGTTSFWVLESYNTGQTAIVPNGGLTDTWFTNYQTVNFAASASDIGTFVVPLPVSISNYKIAALKIGNALGNLNSATVSLYTGAGATGVTAISSTATTITATVGTNATQVMVNANAGTFMYNTTTHGPNLYLHVTTSTPTSNTADVVVQIEPVY
jgi:hypothetical protein